MRGALYFGLPTLIAFYLVAMGGAAVGASVGYTAPNESVAHVTYNGTHLTAGTQEPANVTINFSEDADNVSVVHRYASEVVPQDLVETPFDQQATAYSREFARSMADGAFRIAAATGDFVAGVTYHNQWVPKSVVSGLLEVLAIGPVVGAVGVQVLRIRRFYQ